MATLKYIAHSDDSDFSRKMADHHEHVEKTRRVQKDAENKGILERHAHSLATGSLPHSDIRNITDE